MDYDEELGVAVVRAEGESLRRALGRQIRTSGCAEGTVFESFMEEAGRVRLSDPEGAGGAGGRLKVSDLYALLGEAQGWPSLYLSAGAIHGTCLARGREALAFFEDVGRHNAVDKVAGYMAKHGVAHGEAWRGGGRQVALYDRASDLGDGVEERADGGAGGGVALGLYGGGGGDGAAGEPHVGRAGAGASLYGALSTAAFGAGC